MEDLPSKTIQNEQVSRCSIACTRSKVALGVICGKDVAMPACPGKKVTVVGDLHGQLFDFDHMLSLAGAKSWLGKGDPRRSHLQTK